MGIDRHLNEERASQGLAAVPPAEVSFWYVVNRLGQRFLRDAQQRLGPLTACGPGLWRCELLQRLIFLVTSSELPVDRDNLPLHVLAREPAATEREVARLVVNQPALVELYGSLLAVLHRHTWKEVVAMVRGTRKRPKIDMEPLVDYWGLDQIIESLGFKRIIKHCSAERVILELGSWRIIEKLNPEWVIEKLDPKKVIKHLGVDQFLSRLTPAQRRAIKQCLQER
jgi:hypothetical protein